jgi:hypothetical protein
LSERINAIKDTIQNTRENIAVDYINKDFEKNNTDIAILVFGAAHDFADNVSEINKTLEYKNKIGLVKILPEKDFTKFNIIK